MNQLYKLLEILIKIMLGKYKLYGVAYHKGKFNFCHYIAYLNIGLKDQWYEFNDSSVNIIDNGLPTDNTYILFYIKNDLI